MNLLIFFALPIATIILSAIFQTLINCPFKVAGIAFSIYLIVAFALGGSAELIIAAIVYTIISLVTAFIVMIIQNRNCIIENLCNSSGCSNTNTNSGNCINSNSCACRNR